MKHLLAGLAALILSTVSFAGPRVGPASGALVVAGGGRLGPDVLNRFIELAGGTDAPIVYVPTASGGELTDLNRYKGLFARAGCTNITVLHTRDKAVADTAEFCEPIENAAAVWFGGGRQWRIYDAYAGTRAERAFRGVLDRGGAIGGSSAGATIQGSFLVRGSPRGNQIMMAEGHETGFGYLGGVAIDQHVDARSRERDMLPVIERFPHLLGVGLDEGTAIVVQRDTAEVVGPGRALFYTADQLTRETPWTVLTAGDSYNLFEREPIDD
ncbi:MAG: cyanophycinase [Planctomycetota bacterium]